MKKTNCKQVGMLSGGKWDKMHDISRRVYDTDGVAPTIHTMGGGNTEMKIVDPVIGAIRGRNPMNPSDRRAGIHTEQRLEINPSGMSNTITTVQKDNVVIMAQRPHGKNPGFIKETETAPTITSASFEQNNFIIDDTYGYEEEPRIYEDASPTIRAGRQGLKVAEPIVYDDYNGRVRADQSTIGTLTTNCGSNAERNGVKLIETAQGFQVRKLTPKECWRLMGQTDKAYELARQAMIDKHYNGKDKASSQLYKQAGNSIVVQVLEAVFSQIKGIETEW